MLKADGDERPIGELRTAVLSDLIRRPWLTTHPAVTAKLTIIASLAGLAGSLKTLVMKFATLSDVHWSMSGEVILMSLLGGVGTFFGPVLGAGVVIGLQDLLADQVGEWVTVIIGVIFVLCVLAFRKGIVGELHAWRERRRARAS